MVFRVRVFPFFGTIVTEMVQRPLRTARILVLAKTQYCAPRTMLIRSLPFDVLGIAIDTAWAILEALTLRPRRRRRRVMTGLV